MDYTVLTLPAEKADVLVLANVMHESIHALARQHYSKAQLVAWSPAPRTEEEAKERFAGQTVFQAMDNEGVAAFMTLTDTGYLDFAYAHPRANGKGAADVVFRTLEQFARQQGYSEISSDISKTARAFFERRGFQVVQTQDNDIRGEVLVNFKMRKPLNTIKHVAVFSSHVAATPVGGTLAAPILSAFGLETHLFPTTLLGRHPGFGVPGGGEVSPDTFQSMLEGATETGLFSRTKAILTGYFASPAQVETTIALIDQLKQLEEPPRIIVDPVFGDEDTGLYVPEDIAELIKTELVPRADLITPNAWELGFLTDASDTPSSLEEAQDKADRFDCDVLVTSVVDRQRIGSLLKLQNQNVWFAGTNRLVGGVPRGTGDAASLLFVSHLLNGLKPEGALSKMVANVAALIEQSVCSNLQTLPTGAIPDILQASSTLPVRKLR